MEEIYHIPAMLKETIEGLAIKPNGVYVDVTFGGGGHSRAILEKIEGGHLYSFDQDIEADDQQHEGDKDADDLVGLVQALCLQGVLQELDEDELILQDSDAAAEGDHVNKAVARKLFCPGRSRGKEVAADDLHHDADAERDVEDAADRVKDLAVHLHQLVKTAVFHAHSPLRKPAAEGTAAGWVDQVLKCCRDQITCSGSQLRSRPGS